MSLCYTEFKCPHCDESWVLSFNTVSEKVREAFKDEFKEHLMECERNKIYYNHMMLRYFHVSCN